MTKNVIWTVALSIVAAILQSTLLREIAFLKVVPDLALCIVVFSAYVNGTMPGQISGFFSGLLLDFMSAAPLGMNCLIRTLIGALAGIFKGALFLDTFLMPVILCAGATILKVFIIFILHLIPLLSHLPVYDFSFALVEKNFWIELGLNCISAPLLFLLLKRFKPMVVGRN